MQTCHVFVQTVCARQAGDSHSYINLMGLSELTNKQEACLCCEGLQKIVRTSCWDHSENVHNFVMCHCLSKNPLSSHLPVFRELLF